MWDSAFWIGVPHSEIKKWSILEGDMNGRFAYFRYAVYLDVPARLELGITANSRYRLWVNGTPVVSGPCKGDRYRHYYETVDVSAHLRVGMNTFAIQVLYCNPYSVSDQGDNRAPIFAVASVPAGHRLAVAGKILDEHDEAIGDITTGAAPWKVYLDGSFSLRTKEVSLYLGSISEDVDLSKTPVHWKTGSYDDGEWAMAERMETALPDAFYTNVGILPKFNLLPRPIPLLYERDGCFERVLNAECEDVPDAFAVPAGEKRTILLDAGKITNAYMRYCIHGGSGAKISFTYFEKFSHTERKIKRSDSVNGDIIGLEDSVIVPDTPAREETVLYEPFWFRTFRFLRIHIEAAEDVVTLDAPQFRAIGYPLEIQSRISSSEVWVAKVWQLCTRTLLNCMTETYMDCPFYEQLQFAMDTRLQVLFTFAAGTDTQLARKALEDFHCSRMPDGLIHGKYPCAFPQIISTFSLHYIYMQYEYYRQTGDLTVIRRYRADTDAILEYYDAQIDADGLVGRLGYWEFVDWQKEWTRLPGAPDALSTGPSTIINLMYSYALLCAAEMSDACGRDGLAGEYRNRQKSVVDSIQKLCWDDEARLYREGPQCRQFSQHAQAWAVLNGMLGMDAGQKLMTRALNTPQIVPCSFATSYELFRALEATGLYHLTQPLMERWANLLEWDCTSCPEEPENGRSDCHAWSALPMYEFMRSIAGIHPGEISWRTIAVRPNMEYLPNALGKAATPKGIVYFDYQKNDDVIVYRLTLPDMLYGKLFTKSGTEYSLHPGENIIEECL